MARGEAFEQVTLAIEADVLRRVRGRVGRDKLSSYVNRALGRQLERDGLEDLMDELVAINGPLDEDVVARHVAEWR